MVNSIGIIQYQFDLACDAVKESCVSAGQKVSKDVTDSCHSISTGCQNAVDSVKLKCRATAGKVSETLHNKQIMFFVTCCTSAAYFTPHLFLPTVIITVITRMELTSYLKKTAEFYMKDDRNPYKINPRYENCISALDFTLGTIAGLNGLALATFYITNSWAVYFLPVLGGVAAGSAIAKWGMNTFTCLSTPAPKANQ